MTKREYEKAREQAIKRSDRYKDQIFSRMPRSGQDEVTCQRLLNNELLEITQQYYSPDNKDCHNWN